MNCNKCNETNRMVQIFAKCSDLCSIQNLSTGKEWTGYVPEWCGENGYGDYINLIICRHCGHVQGDWPADKPKDSKDRFKWGKAFGL